MSLLIECFQETFIILITISAFLKFVLYKQKQGDEK